MLLGIGVLIALVCGVALCRAALAALDLWWLRRQPASPSPDWREQRRVWTMACAYRTRRLAHPAHRWRRDAWTVGGTPTGHPNWCPGYAANAA